jgi:transcriptional regulator with PAS, ATPase and Fis domain
MRPLRHRNLVLILARDLADKLASAAFIVDEEGTLVYFNERCGELIGMPYAEAGEMRIEQWSTAFKAMDFQGRLISASDTPLVKALREKSPVHRKLRVKGADDQVRDIAVTAMPLFARNDECVGAMALFWEHTDPDGEG